jgi:hypothetical protein
VNRAERDRILEEVLHCSSDLRRQLLDERCAGNEALRRELESLIEIDARGDADFLDPSREEPEPLRLEKGERVGRYVVHREIGRGGMSRVYEAEDGEIERLVALKVLGASDAGSTARFFDEVRLLGRMQHDHIVRLYDVGEHRGAPYLVMELLVGETLARAIAARRTGGLVQQLDIARQITAAVRQVHEAGIVHQDIKPANVFVGPGRRITLLDFGIARRSVGPANPNAPLAGTPAYMAPEQMQGQPPSKASDMYAVGVLLFELLTGDKPFSSTVSQIFAAKLASERPPAAPMQAAGVPAALQAVVAALLAANPSVRPTIDLAIRDLEAAATEAAGGHAAAGAGGASADGQWGTRPPERREDLARAMVLEDVKREASGRLAQSLPTTAPMPILYELQQHLVDSPWASDFGLAPLPGAAPHSDVFVVFGSPAVAGRLLILGSAGSGKTTVLLQLAEAMTVRAERDAREPIPVLLTLSSWTDDRPVDVWLVEQLKRKYGVHRDQASAWIDARSLTPLLDGLDEVPAARQEACVRAINAFIRDRRPPHLVVCSRLNEYEMLEAKLQLNGAARLMPLDNEQIRRYLARADCVDAWSGISADPGALAMARSPLFLYMMTVAARDNASLGVPQITSVDERRAALCDLFIQQLLRRPRSMPSYSSDRALRWLSQLAAVMRPDGHTEFLIEGLQPDDCLRRPRLRWLYRGVVALCTSAIMFAGLTVVSRLAMALPGGRLTANVSNEMSAFAWLHVLDVLFGLVFCLAPGFVVAARVKIVPIDIVRWSGELARASAGRWLVKVTAAGLDAAVVLGAVTGMMAAAAGILTGPIWTSPPSLQAGFAVGAASGVLVGTLLVRLRPGTLLIAGHSRDGARWTNGLPLGLFCGFVIWLSSFDGLEACGYGVGIALARAASVRDDRTRGALFAKPIVVGLAGGLAAGGMALIAMPLAAARPAAIDQVTRWMPAFATGGLAIGVAATLVVEMHAWLRGRGGRLGPSHDDTPGWVRPVMAGAAVGGVFGVVCGLLWIGGRTEAITDAARVLGGIGLGQLFMVEMPATFILILSLPALAAGGCGALFGLLGGLTGPAVVRRIRPNQGIHHSAANIPLFALLGTLVVGVPFGLVNMAASVALAGATPEPRDWLTLTLFPALLFGLLGGLLPAAACIQHAALRLILWWTGAAPWRYRRFLDWATTQKLLQRIGGRYSFLHVLLRDHFALMASTRGNSSFPDRPGEAAR